MLVEERDWNQTNTSYSGNELYEWNIDALTERQVSIVVHRMLMYSSICLHTNNNNDHAICKMIIAGFTGQLRGWWDDFLTPEEKYAIMNAYKEEIIRETSTDEKGQPAERTSVKKIEDAVYTLVLTILEHFNGRFSNRMRLFELY